MQRSLRWTAGIFAAAVIVHGLDHLRRGIGVVTGVVLGAGTVQLFFAAVAVVLVFRGHRWGPLAAVLVGFASAVGFTAAHLLPHWSAFSDSFVGDRTGANVTAFSWFAALFEIAADVAFGFAGLAAMRRQPQPTAAVTSANPRTSAA